MLRRAFAQITPKRQAIAAAAGANPQRQVAVEPTRTPLVIFEVASQEYAFPLDVVREIVTTPDDLTFVPGSDDAVRGVMPQMDGITFLRMLRSKELPVSSVPVLVTSTEAGPHDMAAARSAGANYYLVKPIKQETLAEYAAIFCGRPR